MGSTVLSAPSEVVMDIAGGLYRELCEMPHWNAVYGSGGRAAAALANGTREVRLHTYVAEAHAGEADRLRARGVEIIARPTGKAVVFAYFHPLSRPHLQPSADSLARQPPLHVNADVVLRFGLVEGDAVIKARRAVFDPQTARRSASFSANGSRAADLALVLNEGELRALAGQDDLQAAAAVALSREAASVLVLKQGVRGAQVFMADGSVAHIPAYQSLEVFKIGTGDVFSAVFAWEWGETGLPPAEAADRASRAVAAYAESRELPPPGRDGRAPVGAGPPRGVVLLLGRADSLGRRFVLEEARFGLSELGLEVNCPGLSWTRTGDVASPAAVLAIAEALSDAEISGLATKYPGLPFVVLQQPQAAAAPKAGMTFTADFATALYKVAWAAS